ncbi:MAG: Uma2 family endonuclease [Halothece sp.]
MNTATTKTLTFDEFLQWKPENGHYELHEGIIIKMQPTGKHEEIVEFLQTELTLEARKKEYPFRFPKNVLIKALNGESGYLPDVLVMQRNAMENEPLWEASSTLTRGESIPLVIEVVSSNWRDDYLTKLRDYELLGIQEYWIVDYFGYGGVRYLGSPKQPTISVYMLVDGEYHLRQFRDHDVIQSQVFPELDLTAQPIFQG